MRGLFHILSLYFTPSFISCGWLIESKRPPWSSIPNEVIFSFCFGLTLLGLYLLNRKPKLHLSAVTWVLVAWALLPWVQYAFGLISWPGDAYVVSLYLAALALTVATTQNLKHRTRDQWLDMLAMALLLGSVASVGLQLLQISGLPIEWVRRVDPNRPSANLAQPNLLASLLLLGLLAAHYLQRVHRISTGFFVLIAVVLSVGIGFTGSRAALVGGVVVAAWHVWVWRTNRSKASIFMVTLPMWLLVVFTASRWLLAYAQQFAIQGLTPSSLNPEVIRMGSSLRIEAWTMFLHRLWEAPWWGYGMGQTGMAHLLGQSHLHPFGAHFKHAHNQPLEILLWLGIPLGLLVLATAAYFVLKALRARNERQMLASSGMLVLISHSMFEFPLHYSYFLLPFGVFLAYNSPAYSAAKKWIERQPSANSLAKSQGSLPWLALPAALLLVGAGLLYRDHTQVERLMLRWGLHQLAGSQVPFSFDDTSLGLMAHWQKLLYYSSPSLHLLTQDVDLQAFDKVAKRFPTTNVLLNYAIQLTLAGKPEQAHIWLKRACSIHSRQHCEQLKARWEALPPLTTDAPNPAWPQTVFEALQ